MKIKKPVMCEVIKKYLDFFTTHRSPTFSRQPLVHSHLAASYLWGRRARGTLSFIIVMLCLMWSQTHPVSEFVQVKKTMHEKPSKVKEEIVETLESLLTWSSDMIASIAQEQRLIVQKVREVTQSEGAFEQKNPHELKRYRDLLKKMEEDFEKQTRHIHMQFVQLKKDFSHN